MFKRRAMASVIAMGMVLAACSSSNTKPSASTSDGAAVASLPQGSEPVTLD